MIDCCDRMRRMGTTFEKEGETKVGLDTGQWPPAAFHYCPWCGEEVSDAT